MPPPDLRPGDQATACRAGHASANSCGLSRGIVERARARYVRRTVKRFRTTLLPLPAVLAVCAATTHAQTAIPIRQLAPIEATTTETWTTAFLKAWEWSDGRVVVTDRVKNGKLLVFDAKLGAGKVIADASLVVAGMVAFGSFVALPYANDSTAVIDAPNAGVLILDRDGKQARIMALPNGKDARHIGTGAYGNSIDHMGRLLYRVVEFGQAPGTPAPAASSPPATIDSGPIVRADFVRRVVDTVGRIYIDIDEQTLSASGDAVRRVKNIPGGSWDDWAVLSDGSIAIVRHHDYHIDWVNPDGTRSSTPKMPLDWRRRSDEEKQAIIDTVKRQYAMMDSMRKSTEATEAYKQLMRERPGMQSSVPQRTWATLAEIPDYTPPIRGANSLYPDADNRLWILPTTSAQARGGLLFDVVNKKGEIEERVQLPANAAIAGFGKNGVVFLRVVQPDGKNVIARTHIVR